MTIKIYADLSEYDEDPTHTTTGKSEFLFAVVEVSCDRCNFCEQVATFGTAVLCAKNHAASHKGRYD